MRGNTRRVVFALSLLLSACASASDGKVELEAAESVGSTTTQTTVGSERDTAPEPQPNSDVEGSTAPVSMVELLDRVPRAAYDIAAAESGSIQLELVDFAGAGALTGLPRPPATDVQAALDWIVTISTDAPEGSGFAVFTQGFPDREAFPFPDEVSAELGFSLLDLDQIAYLSAPPLSYYAVSGPSLELADGLTELGGGIVTAGEGDDDVFDFEQTTAARPFGIPLRMAQRDGVVGVSTSTPAIESFAAEEPSMMEVAAFADAAAALDSVGSVSAMLLQLDFTQGGPGSEVEEVAGLPRVSVPFDTVAIGATQLDGQAAIAVAYVFSDEAAAEIARPELDDLWRSGPLVTQRTMVAERFAIQSADVLGRVVLVTATPTEGGSTLGALDLVFRGELIFTSP